jgi:hypothetical protein
MAKAYDPDRLSESETLNMLLPTWLDELHESYGVWGLAYLESVVKACDINAE